MWDSIIAAVQEQQNTLSDDLMGSITLTLLQRLSWFTALASPSKEPAQLLRDTTLQRSISSLYSSHHVEVLLKVAETSLHTYHSMVTIQSLISVWTALLAFVEARPPASSSTQKQASSSSSSQYSSEALHSRRQGLHSMFRTLDSQVEDTSMPSSELIFTSKMQVRLKLSTYLALLLISFHFIVEYEVPQNARLLAPRRTCAFHLFRTY